MRCMNSIGGGIPPFYRKCQGAIDPLDSYLTPFARQKCLVHYCNNADFRDSI